MPSSAVRGRGRLPVVVGGTGLYIRALLRGLDPAPPADPEFRRELAALAAREGRPALHARLERGGSRGGAAAASRTITCGSCAPSRWPRAGAERAAQTRWQEIRPRRYRVTYVGLTMDRARRWPVGSSPRAAAFVAAGLARRGRAPARAGLRRLAARPCRRSAIASSSRVARGALIGPTRCGSCSATPCATPSVSGRGSRASRISQWIDVEKLGGAEGVADADRPGQLERSLAGR